jgi:hypothetical protein
MRIATGAIMPVFQGSLGAEGPPIGRQARRSLAPEAKNASVDSAGVGRRMTPFR